MLFFIKTKLSSRLCLTHKRVTQKYRNSTLIREKKKKKNTCARIGSGRYSEFSGSDLKKWFRCIPKQNLILYEIFSKTQEQSIIFWESLISAGAAVVITACERKSIQRYSKYAILLMLQQGNMYSSRGFWAKVQCKLCTCDSNQVAIFFVPKWQYLKQKFTFFCNCTFTTCAFHFYCFYWPQYCSFHVERFLTIGISRAHIHS